MTDWEQLRLDAESARQAKDKVRAEQGWLAALNAASEFGELDPRYVYSLENVAELYYSQGAYAEAEPHCVKLLQLTRARLGADHPDIGVITTNLGMLYHELGQLDKAEQHYKVAWHLRKKIGTHHPQMVHLVTNYSRLLEATGRKEQAEELKSTAESIASGKWHRSGHYDALTLEEIEAKSAETAVQEAPPTVVILSRTIHKMPALIDHKAPDAMREWTELMNEGDMALMAEDFPAAEKCFKKALETARIFDESDGRLMMTLESLTEVLWQQEKYDEAEPLCKLTLEVYESQLGPTHYDVGIIANNLAMLYHTVDKFEQAEPFYKRALAIRTATEGTSNPEVITLMNNYANLLQSTNREKEAKNLRAHILSLTSGKWNRCGQFKALPAATPLKATDTSNLEELRLPASKAAAESTATEQYKPKPTDSGKIYDRLVDVIDKAQPDKHRKN
jgi:tetratricopeptide (TPR) repeat protein